MLSARASQTSRHATEIDETQRLAALHALAILDTLPEAVFDDATGAAAAFCQAPIALVSLIDECRQWFKSRVGLDVAETSRDVAFCDHAIRSDDVLVVEDALQDPRFAANPLVTGAPHIRAYAGAPIVTREGARLGTLCVIHTEPTRLSDRQIEGLARLSRLISSHLDTRRQAMEVHHLLTEQSVWTQAEARYKTIIESMNEGVMTFDADGRVMEVNPAASAILGLTQEQIAQRAPYEEGWSFVNREGRALRRHERPVWRALHEGLQQRETILGVELPGGEKRWLRVSCAPVHTRGGPAQAVVTFADVTEIEQAHADLCANEARLTMALNVASAATFEQDLESGSIATSPGMAHMASPVADATQRRYSALLSPVHHEDRPAARAAWRAHRRGGPALDLELRLARPDGAPQRWVRAYAQARRDAQGKPTHIIGLIKDITQRKEQALALEQALVQAEAAADAKSAFLATMSHEIRTPLNGVIGVASALSQMQMSKAQHEMVGVIERSAETLERILSDVLDTSKIEAGKLTIESAPFVLRDEVEAAASLMRVGADKKGLLFRIAPGRIGPGRFVGDAMRLRQIVTNLLSNAIKFTPAGEVVLSFDVEPPSAPYKPHLLVLDVVDTGIGFDPVLAARLFDRFQQADSSITRRFGGTGLGLSISRGLAEAMGGALSADSSPGVGSVFRLILPLEAAPSQLGASSGEHSIDNDYANRFSRRMKVLLVEDNPANQKVGSLLLAPLNVDLTIVDNGKDAVATVEAHRFDLILMDMTMPEMDGLSATRAIREFEKAGGRKPCAIAMLTAHAAPEHIAAARAAGCDHHIAKPVSARNLLAGIGETLARAAGVAAPA